MLGTITKPTTLGTISMSLQAWMRWIIVTTHSGPFSCSGSTPTLRPIRSTKARPVKWPTGRWRFSMSKSTNLPWHLISSGVSGLWFRPRSPPSTLTSWDTQSCASTSTSKWNWRWLSWTYPNKSSRPLVFSSSCSSSLPTCSEPHMTTAERPVGIYVGRSQTESLSCSVPTGPLYMSLSL